MRYFAHLSSLLYCLVALPLAAYADITDQQAKIFLTRATFGPTPETLQQLKKLGYESWIDQQLAMSVGKRFVNRSMQIAMQAEPTTDWFVDGKFSPPRSSPYWIYVNSAWWEQALTAPDQLRQRIAFALSEIFVVSYSATPYLRERAESMAAWADLLQTHATGSFRELMSAVTYSPTMGIFLTYHGNRKANPTKGSAPDENYARELMQLFTLGLYKIDLSGKEKLSDSGERIPTYTQEDVINLARVFTGWDMPGNARFGQRSLNGGNLLSPMEFSEQFHDKGEKVLLGATIPAGLDGRDDVEAALDILFSQPEVAPFISRLLIQRFTTSNPTPQYIERVAKVFVDNGEGKRGDLAAVVKAILLDQEAMAALASPTPTFGKVKEPVLMLTQFLRAMKVAPSPEFVTKQGGKMKDVYWVRKLGIGQEPFQASSVFNFFDDDFSPPDLGDGVLSPELQLLDSGTLIDFSNTLQFIMNQREAFKLNNLPEARRKALESNRAHSRLSIDLDFTKELALLRDSGPEAAYQLLETRLLSQPASDNTRQVVFETLVQGAAATSDRVARTKLVDAIVMLATSPEYWVQL